ncbi:MAG: dTDP-4-dehydrorhamnose reductase [Candidatus Eisenbacteria bacterium]
MGSDTPGTGRGTERVLVTGSAGMLGTELVPLLRGEFEVTAADLDDFDLRDGAATDAFVSRVAPDLIINCAAYTDVDGAEADPAAAFDVNAGGAGNVAAAGERAGARVVQISTDYVFDGTGRRPYREEDEPSPLGAYGRSKHEGERRVIECSSDPLIVRTAWLYGHAGPNFVEKVLSLATSGRALRVVNDQVGAPTNVRDLAWAIRELIAAEATGVVNATNAGSCSWFDFAREILDRAGHTGVPIEPVTSDEFPRPAPRPGYSVLSLAKLVSLTGREPRNWRDALAEYIAER